MFGVSLFSTITTTGVVSVPVFSVSPPEHPVIVGERSAPINNTLASFWSEVGGMVVFIWLASCCGVGGNSHGDICEWKTVEDCWHEHTSRAPSRSSMPARKVRSRVATSAFREVAFGVASCHTCVHARAVGVRCCAHLP